MTLTAPNKVVMDAPSSSDVVLSVQGVSKKFCRDLKRSLMYGMQDISKEMLGLRGNKNDSLRKNEFWALQDVSFELKRGEALGLVGKNGSGKSTLLRVIAGLIKPDVGTVQVKGRVAPLIALGAGFNPILTGRENIYANMSILGLSKAEIDERFDEVVEFAEIGDAIDAPVQSYSSGMGARLGFASAVFTEPDILLIDEVLSVGDMRFRQKCLKKIDDLRKNEISLILVSHSTQTIMGVSQNIAYLSKGKIKAVGNPFSVFQEYQNDLFRQDISSTSGLLEMPMTAEREKLDFAIQSIFFRDSNEAKIKAPICSEPLFLCIKVIAQDNLANLGIVIVIQEIGGGEGEPILFLDSFQDQERIEISRGLNEIQVFFPYVGLRPGIYNAKILVRKNSLHTLDYTDSFQFFVKSDTSIVNRCAFYQPRVWNAKTKSEKKHLSS